MKAAIGRAKKMMIPPNSSIEAEAHATARHPLALAKSGRPAPKDWPTWVEAAIVKPEPTTKENERI